MAFPLAAAITAGAGLLGTGVSAGVSSNLNKRNRKFAREMYTRQREDALSDWHMTNAYNDPSAVMQRLQSAGLNPNLIVSGGEATNMAGIPPQASSHNPKTQAPEFDLGSVAGNAIYGMQAMANIRRTEAETQAINERTNQQQFENAVRDALGVDHYATNEQVLAKTRQAEQSIKELGFSKDLADYNAWAAAGFEGKPTDDPSSPLARAYKAGLDRTMVELDNAKSLGNIRRFEATIKQFESNLAQQGISPNSPWFVKIIGDLFSKFFGFGIGSLTSDIGNSIH